MQIRRENQSDTLFRLLLHCIHIAKKTGDIMVRVHNSNGKRYSRIGGPAFVIRFGQRVPTLSVYSMKRKKKRMFLVNYAAATF